MKEIWADVAGYEGYYQVSNMGRVRSVDRIVTRKNGTLQRCRGRILTPYGSKSTHHYMQVHLRKGSCDTNVPVHRLVANAFLPRFDGCDVVDHIDADMFNNRADNLRWCTQEENLRFCREQGRAHFPHYRDWQPEVQRRYSQKCRKPIVRGDGKRYECTADAALDMGVTYAAISHVLRGLSKTCKGHTFSYA